MIKGDRISLVDPLTHETLREKGGFLVNAKTLEPVAPIIDGIPRFVDADKNYAESFGWQWKKWAHARSDARNPGHRLRQVIMQRTHFEEYDLPGKSILECGMGGGDDTEILLQLPFAEIHSFDISTSVERAMKFLKDDRLVISQASIFHIPYPDASFDVVYCHRVLQHTPDPQRALRKICQKVKPGGILFAHSYKRSWRHMMEWRYKYRWLSKRLPWKGIYFYVDRCGPPLHRIVQRMYRTRLGMAFAYNFVPFYNLPREDYSHLSDEQFLELMQHITFDALTPWHDHPMTSRTFRRIIEEEGFRIEHLHDPKVSPVYCTAIRQ